MDFHYLGLLQVSELIRSREISAEEVTETLLARIGRLDGKLHSVQMLLAD